MTKVKNRIKGIINSVKSAVGLSVLTARESQGSFFWYTKLRLMPKTNIELPFSLGRSVRGCAFADYIDRDPFAEMVEGILTSDDDEHAIDFLRACYENETRSSVASVMKELAPTSLSDLPLWAIVMPWEKISVQDKMDFYPKLYRKNREAYGADFEADASDISSAQMYSHDVAKSQVKQTRQLVNSIKSHGVLKTKELPLVYILRNGSEWRWCMTGEGNHRAYIFALMKQPLMLAEVYAFVDREKAHCWPNVFNGNYTNKEGLSVFDSFFEGKNCIRGMV